MMKLLVAENDSTMRLGLRSVLSQSLQSVVIDEVCGPQDLMTSLRFRDYELLILEPLIAGGAGESLIRQIKRLKPASNVLIYTAIDEQTFGLRALQSGANGYLMKTCSIGELLAAVGRVGQGKPHISATLAEEVALSTSLGHEHTPHERLTEREWVIFAMLVCGHTVSGIATQLDLSIRTVSTHKSRIMVKLRVDTLSALVQYAISQCLLDACLTRYNSPVAV